MNGTTDYYAILGVLPSADIVVIRAAFRSLAQKYHPDKWAGDPSEANQRMRELNEAYEVLSDERRRERYDSQRRQDSNDDFDFDETMRSAFGDAERAQNADWTIALEFYPDLDDIYKRLKRTSDKLAFAFRSAMLEAKQFNKRHNIADNMEKQFLQKYFGKGDRIIQFAKELIRGGHKTAAKELNRMVAVLGTDADQGLVIHRIKDKYFPRNIVAEIKSCAQRLIKTQYVSDAYMLISLLGGAVEERAYGRYIFGRTELVVLLAGESRTFETQRDMVLWIMREVAPKYL
jgi:curved DNA-binding protein CbpA